MKKKNGIAVGEMSRNFLILEFNRILRTFCIFYRNILFNVLLYVKKIFNSLFSQNYNTLNNFQILVEWSMFMNYLKLYF